MAKEKCSETQHSLSQALEQGLAIDILWHFTTRYGTSEEYAIEEITAQYAHVEDISLLLSTLVDLQLIVEKLEYDDSNHWNPVKRTGALRLSHDTLAPILRSEFERSTRPGQAARKLLEQKAILAQNAQNVLLSQAELKLIQEGEAGMRQKTPAEEKLIERSIIAINTRKKRRLASGMSLSLLFLLMCFVLAQLWINGREKTLFNEAVAELQNKNFEKSFLLAARAHRLQKSEISRQLLYECAINNAIHNPQLLKSSKKYTRQTGNKFSISPDSQFLLTHSRDFNFNPIFSNFPNSFLFKMNDSSLDLVGTLRGIEGRFSSNSQIVITEHTQNDSSFLYQIMEDKLVRFVGPMKGVSIKFSPQLSHVLTMSRGKNPLGENQHFYSYLYNIADPEHLIFIDSMLGYGGEFSPNGRYIVTDSGSKSLTYLSFIVENKLLFLGELEGWMSQFSSDSRFIRTINNLDKDKVFLYELKDHVFKKCLERTSAFLNVTPVEKVFFINQQSANSPVLIKKNKGSQFDTIQKLKGADFIEFSPNQKLALTSDKQSKHSFLYKIEPNGHYAFIDSVKGIYGDFSKDNCFILIHEEPDSQYALHKINAEADLQKVGFIPTNNCEFGPVQHTLVSYDDNRDESEMYEINPGTGQLTVKSRFEGGSINLSKDGKYAFSVSDSDNQLFLYALGKNIKTRIYLPNASWHTSFIKKNGMVLANEHRDTILIWHQNPLSLNEEEIMNMFGLNK
ncbi:MAG: WD40 repeat domain-containing protein [Phaeodactylibacter sp.]|nr:WD40 repeat domain-containing protein [Phaeodactylibacter sp.]